MTTTYFTDQFFFFTYLNLGLCVCSHSSE